uniref:Putative tick defensins 1 n=1 Tax=Amblyomma triste TaxID=251400 RepID=A0A023G3L4_AMBTT
MIVAVALLTWIAQYPSAECCYNNKRVGFCPNEGYVYEKVCPGVPYQSCKPWSLRCACTKNALRREDGECVTSKEECERGKKKSPKRPVQKGNEGVADNPPEIPESPPPARPTTPEELEIPPPRTPSGPRYYSGGSNGCPSNNEKCAASCRTLGYPYSICDEYLSSDCYCYGQRVNTQSESPGKRNVRPQVPWPYGKILRTGKLIQQLRKPYGCPSNVQQCFDECQRRGVEGAFCGVHTPHNCFCEAFLPPNDWDYGDESEYKEGETGPLSCPTDDYCYLVCTSQGHSGGYCSGEQPVCHCYKMYTYNLPKAKQIEKELNQLQSRNYKEVVQQILQSPQKLLLVRVSSNAWLAVECRCMQSEFVGTSPNLQRSVTCHGLAYERSEELRWFNRTETLDFSVKFGSPGTTIELTSESDRLPFGLHSPYVVLVATSTCMVLKVFQTAIENPICALWGLEDAKGNNESACFETMRAMCMEPFTDTFNEIDECSRKEIGGTYKKIRKSVAGLA